MTTTMTTTSGLLDTFGRVATDLRVSLTDHCNLRCTYCMPAEGVPWSPAETVLTDDEVLRLLQIGITDLGIREVRFTGGEPLLRRGLVDIVRRTREIDPDVEISLTSNGIGLDRLAGPLKDAGLDRLNVSLDSIDARTFERITRRDRLHSVIAGLEAVRAAGLDPIKLNAVLVRGVNDQEAPALLQWSLEQGYQLRFIEQMPLDRGHTWQRSAMITAAETLALLQTRFDLRPADEPRGSSPAELYAIAGTDQVVGIIASVSHPFCSACDRVRLTADGQIRNCLFAREESDLRTALRGGAGDEEIAQRWRSAMVTKRAGHGIDDPAFVQPERSMSAIGG